MSLNIALTERDRHPLDLVGSYCEIYWSSTNRLAKRQCEKCVYVVRGVVGDMVCVELVYDAIEGEHRHDHIYWVPVTAIQYMRMLTEHAASYRIESLEREPGHAGPRD